MNPIFLLTVAVTIVFAGEDTCDSFGDWRDWTDECSWLPLSAVRTDLIQACDVIVNNVEQLPTFPPLPDGFPTEPCGHCGFKARCRKRAQQEGCSPVDLEHQHCDEGDAGAICNLPTIVRPDYNLGCTYGAMPYLLRQCADRPELPDWKRGQMKRIIDTLPKMHCAEVDDECKCCCDPYVLNANFTECVLREDPAECDQPGDWNDWSEQCVAFPLVYMVDAIRWHCRMPLPSISDNPAIKDFEEKFSLPESGCGMCAFKIKCTMECMKNRTDKACPSFDIDKKACGNDECDGCGDVCQMPKIDGGCNFMRSFVDFYPLREELQNQTSDKTRAWHNGMRMLLALPLPHGNCVEKDDNCMCCCHPYEPNEDGTRCVVKNMCLTAVEAGVTFDMNLSDATWFW